MAEVEYLPSWWCAICEAMAGNCTHPIPDPNVRSVAPVTEEKNDD